MGVNFNEGGMDMMKKALLLKLLVAALIMFCFAFQVPASGDSVICGGIDGAEPDCEDFTTTFANHLSNDRIWYDDYYHPDYGVDYGYLTKGANDVVCDSVVNFCNSNAYFPLHRFPLDDPDTYYIGPCEE